MSNIDKISNRLPTWANPDTVPGMRFDNGPYIGKIKDNRDPLRLGRLQVYIADLGGSEDNVTNWRTVSFASPFMGSTDQESYAQESPQTNTNDRNSFTTVKHTYGMWYSVPDIGNLVLITFVMGDPQRGYWFACVPNTISNHMIPAIGASSDIDISNLQNTQLSKAIESGESYPVVEFNTSSQSVNWENFRSAKKPLHEQQVKILLEQGLDRKKLTGSRGAITTSTQRDSPSSLFGISTPGRAPFRITPTDQPAPVKYRLGGHTFVMDDGDANGGNNLVRLRSSSGHQILMDDTEQILYIMNASGTTYIEMNAAGHLNVYSSNSINFRTKADFNFHADGNFNIDVAGAFKVNAKGALLMQSDSIIARANKSALIHGGSVQLGSDGRLDLHTTGGGSFTASQAIMISGKTIGLNSGSGPQVQKPRDLPLRSFDDTERDSNGKWQVQSNKIRSVVNILPTHEPWTRKIGKSSSASNAGSVDRSQDGVGLDQQSNADTSRVGSTVADSAGRGVVTSSSGQVVLDSEGNPVLTGTRDTGIEQAATSTMKANKLANAADMVRSDAATAVSVGTLNELEGKALKTQIAKTESNFKYGVENEFGYLGRYQFGAAALVDRGFITRGAYEQYGGSKGGNNALDDPKAWAGPEALKNGIRSKEDFLANASVQEQVMDAHLKANYQTAVKIGAIKPGDDNATKAGILQTSHLLGPAGAKKWRSSGGGSDAYGTTGTDYFNYGSYAINRLGKGP